MKRILCYGDSNTWGYDRDNDCRFDEHTRWTGVMQDILGQDYRVWEAGLCGRTTAFEDPTMPIRDGAAYFEMVLQTCEPVDCIIFVLGTNDVKDMFNISPLIITYGMERLLRECRRLLSEKTQNTKIILACPVVPVADDNGVYWYDMSAQSTHKGEQLRWRYKELAEQSGCAFVDLNEIVSPCGADGVHLDSDGQKLVGTVMADLVKNLLKDK